MNFAKVRADHSLLQRVRVNLRGAGIYIKGTPSDDLSESIHLLSLPGDAAGGRRGGWALQSLESPEQAVFQLAGQIK